MKTWFRSLLVIAIATVPLNGLIAAASVGDLESINHEALQKAKSFSTASSKLTNDFMFDLKVRIGVVPPPLF